MKTVRLLFVMLIVAAGALPDGMGRRAQPGAFTGGSKSEKSKPVPGRDSGRSKPAGERAEASICWNKLLFRGGQGQSVWLIIAARELQLTLYLY